MAFEEFVTINSLKMGVAGFCAPRDLTPFLAKGPLEGEDVNIPGSAGRTARDRIAGPLDILPQFLVFGQNDKDGVSHADPRLGVIANLETIKTSLLTNSTVPIVHTFSDASTNSGTGIVRSIDVAAHDSGQIGRVFRITVDIRIHAGELT